MKAVNCQKFIDVKEYTDRKETFGALLCCIFLVLKSSKGYSRASFFFLLTIHFGLPFIILVKTYLGAGVKCKVLMWNISQTILTVSHMLTFEQRTIRRFYQRIRIFRLEKKLRCS